ncbi:uncharacterized protein [Montipora capricornis]|uniref:uncharacterized protein n=1 Tax=Montipora capricornis TaxID=246305 RepID=UPI0035F1DED4
MNSFILVLVPLMVFAFPNALAITCYTCIPDQNTMRTCTTPEELRSMECPTPNVNMSMNVPGMNMSMNVSGVNISLTYDACLTTRIVANVPNLGQLTSYYLSCGMQNNGSTASMPNCSMSQSGICEVAEGALMGTGITIVSCDNTCCTTDNCNEVEQPSTTPSTNEETTMASTTSGMDQVRPQFLGLLMMFAGILFRKIDQPF